MPSQLQSSRLSEGVVRNLLEAIRRGEYPTGGKLPSERELAESFGVSRVVVREGLRMLELLEVIQVRQGSGAYVASPKVSRSGRLLHHWLLAHRGEVLELLEVREALEASAARNAAARVAKVEVPRGTEDEIDVLVANDLAFHNSIAAESGNSVLASIISELNGVLEESRYAMFSLPGRPKRSHRDHMKIARAIGQGDIDAAHAAMRDHIARTKSEIEKLNEGMAY
jgi:GntR family transcriptional repressor for pyruvate dehydrogenase complex